MQYEFDGGVWYHGDCLDVMKNLPDNSVDMVLCDLPYGTTYCAWDAIIPFDDLWAAYERVVRDDGAIVLTSSQPFTSALVMSKPKWFRCEWIWDKVNAANFANAKKQPMKTHESVLVFGQKSPVYYPVMTPGKPNHKQGKSTSNKSDTRLISGRVADDLSGMKYPKSIQTFAKHSSQVGLHPTQKPVELFEYLIQTYSQPGETVLDNCAGSGTTAIAAFNLKRKWICIEKEQKYSDIARDRITTRLNELIII